MRFLYLLFCNYVLANLFLQKVPTPTIESLPCPPMESENIKRSASVKTPKPTPITTTVEGTSVTPRQRPKGQTVSTGPISLSGQIVGQISGQGNQTQTTPANSISYVQVRLINCTRYLCLKYTKMFKYHRQIID